MTDAIEVDDSVRAILKRAFCWNDAKFEEAKQGNWPMYRAASAAFAAGCATRHDSNALDPATVECPKNSESLRTSLAKGEQ